MIGERRIPARWRNRVNAGFLMARTTAAALVALAFLSGCGNARGDWAKPGADPAAAAQAYQDCEAAARAAVEPEIAIDKDIIATRGGDWQRANVFDQQTGMMGTGIARRQAAMIDSCMRGKGFSQAR